MSNSIRAGMSMDRLERLSALLEADVLSERIPGAVVLLWRRGEPVLERAWGFRDRAANASMSPTDLFRLASMTKPITSLAVMMLAEEGRLLLPDPLADYLPEFASTRVGVEENGALRLVDALRSVTIQDLLRHTSGLTYGLFGRSRVKDAYNEAGVFSLSNTNQEMCARLARLPLQSQPGSRWDYSMSTDVLGRVVEVVSGRSLGEFFAERILGPLGMQDTGFLLPPGKSARMAQPAAGGASVPMADHTIPWAWQSGGGGLYGSAQDYLRFCRMMLGGGELEGVRLVAPSTVALMTSDHLPPGIAYAEITRVLLGPESPMPEMGQGFGLGFAVRTHRGRNPLPGSVGEYYWAGALGTYFWIDPVEQMIAIFLSQAPADRLHYRSVMRQACYQAVLA